MSECICETCGQQIQERPPRPLDMIDQLYLAFGKCCAGCDFWQQDEMCSRLVGRCTKRASGKGVMFDASFPGSVERFTHYERTNAKYVCDQFQDTFDWTQLGVENPS